jgi:hypothetical protein
MTESRAASTGTSPRVNGLMRHDTLFMSSRKAWQAWRGMTGIVVFPTRLCNKNYIVLAPEIVKGRALYRNISLPKVIYISIERRVLLRILLTTKESPYNYISLRLVDLVLRLSIRVSQ